MESLQFDVMKAYKDKIHNDDFKEFLYKLDEKTLIEMEEELRDLDQKYYVGFKQFYIKDQSEIFDELTVTRKILTERVKLPFMHIVELIKKRISFFGIYSLYDQIELTQYKLDHMKEQLDKSSNMIIHHQNQLRVNFNQLNDNFEDDKEEALNLKNIQAKMKVRVTQIIRDRKQD